MPGNLLCFAQCLSRLHDRKLLYIDISIDISIDIALTDRAGGAGGRGQKVCVPLRRCTLPGHEGRNG